MTAFSKTPLPAERSGAAPSQALADFREGAARMPPPYAIPADVTLREQTVGGVPCLVAQPAEVHGTVLYLHGGGFRLGSPRLSSTFAAQLAARTGLRFVIPDYRLAPEHPFPAALHDIAAVHAQLASEGAGPMLIGGDSAGGNLAAVTALNATEGTFGAVVLISPWLDLAATAPSFSANSGTDQLFSLSAAKEAAQTYLQGHRPNDPLVSPLRAIAPALPPTLVLVGTAEVLLDDSTRFAGLLASAGNTVELHCITGMQHVAVTLNSAWIGADRSMDVLADFLRRHRGGGAS